MRLNRNEYEIIINILNEFKNILIINIINNIT